MTVTSFVPGEPAGVVHWRCVASTTFTSAHGAAPTFTRRADRPGGAAALERDARPAGRRAGARRRRRTRRRRSRRGACALAPSGRCGCARPPARARRAASGSPRASDRSRRSRDGSARSADPHAQLRREPAPRHRVRVPPVHGPCDGTSPSMPNGSPRSTSRFPRRPRQAGTSSSPASSP